MRVAAVLAALAVLFFGGLASAGTIHLEIGSFDPLVGEMPLPAELKVGPDEYSDYGYYLVQFDGPVTQGMRESLALAGAEIYGHIPEFTFLVRLEGSSVQEVSSLEHVTWVGPFHPAYKISPAIGKLEFVSPERRQDDGVLLFVRVFGNLDGVADRLRAMDCVIEDRVDDGFTRRLLVHARRDQIESIARIKDVWWVEEVPEFTVMNNTTKWVVQSNVNGWTPVWDHGIHGEGQIATIMDTGVDYNSCWFRHEGNMAPGPSHRKVIHYATYGGGRPYDGCDVGHGSHVAGTICGDQSYINPGNYNYNGMAYAAKLTVQDIGSDDWSACNLGLVSVPSSLTAAFNDSYNRGARVHSNSWGSTSNQYDGYCVDVDNAMWNHKDFLVCFAAGNSGPGGSTVGSPGTAKNCVTVGATRQAPSQDVVASYSSRGPASDGRYKPTVMAPGGESPTYITSVDNDPGNPPAPTCRTASSPFQGTSMATPAVAGSALNVRQYYVDGYYPNGEAGTGDPFEPSAALVKATLITSTDDMGSADIPNNNEGWGRILLDDALYFEGDVRELIAEDVESGLHTGGTWTKEFDVDASSEPLVVTLVWTDYPGTAGSGIKLVNDLDLTVIAPGGTQYKGNVFSGGFSAPGGSYDRKNVEECVRVSTPAQGTWTVRVSGYNVPHGPQPFALVVAGAFANWPPGGASDAEESSQLGVGKAFVTALPNPTSGWTALSYGLPAGFRGHVNLRVLDVSGRSVRTLVSKGQMSGTYSVTWNGLDDFGRRVAPGVYFATLEGAGSEMARAKIVVSR